VDNHEPDLGYVEAAARSVATVLRPGNLVVLESTVPVGTTEQLEHWLAEERPDLTFPHAHGENSDIRVAHCPERVLPGKVMQELINNDRILGGLTPRCSEVAASLYRTFVRGECVITDARTAEMAKLTENSFRDVNELSFICEKLDINVWELIELTNLHPRVDILQPGPGVGGHCIAVDPWFIVSRSPEEARLIRTAREVNDSKPAWVIAQVEKAIASHLAENPTKSASDVKLACYGVAYKPDVDDLRESPAVTIVEELVKLHSGPLLIIEPNIVTLPGTLETCELVIEAEARRSADVHIMLVDHREFRGSRPPNGKVVDTRGVWQ
jgi:UDP-N-acetyl-D-mannosaminuronic acid dehydrogenase